MRRVALIVAGLLVAALLIALPAIGSNGSTGDYKVRGIFDNGSFVVNGEEVRVAGATVGTVESVDVTSNTEIASDEGGPHAVPGKAVVVMKINDSGFKDFRTDASCLIRPQSLIGEKFIDPPSRAQRARRLRRRSSRSPTGSPARVSTSCRSRTTARPSTSI